MVVENLQNTLLTIIALAAGIAALAGLFLLESFFRGKLRDLFEDTNYLISFFLASGYFLYALGEVSFYLMRVVFNIESATGIQDVYWSGGALLILVSFLALTLALFRQKGEIGSLGIMAGIGVVLLVLVLIIVPSGSFFTRFYPIMSALIVTFASSAFFFRSRLGSWTQPLQLFLLASGAIFLGDLFFGLVTATGGYGTVGMIADIFYLLGYSSSAVAFITFRSQFHKAALK